MRGIIEIVVYDRSVKAQKIVFDLEKNGLQIVR